MSDAAAAAQGGSESATLPYLALAVGILSLGFSAIFVRWAQAPGIITSFYRMLRMPTARAR